MLSRRLRLLQTDEVTQLMTDVVIVIVYSRLTIFLKTAYVTACSYLNVVVLVNRPILF